MRKVDLAEELRKRCGIPTKKQSLKIVASLIQIVRDEVINGGEVSLVGLGTFSAYIRKPKKGCTLTNPSERIEHPSIRSPRFRAAITFRKAVR